MCAHLSRDTIGHRTYVPHENLYTYLFLLTALGPTRYLLFLGLGLGPAIYDTIR